MKKTIHIQLPKLIKAGEAKGGTKLAGAFTCASYGAVYELNDGKYVYEHQEYTACHAGMATHHRYGTNYPNSKLVTNLNALNMKRLNAHPEEDVRRFLEWFLNYSPYHKAWVTKSPKTALKNGYLVGNPEEQCNVYVGAFIATRCLWEYSEVAVVWNGFVSKGMNPDLAFVLAHHFGGTKTKVTLQGHGGHMAIDGYNKGQYGEGVGLKKSYFANFIKHNPIKDKSYLETPNYRGKIHKTWNSEREDVNGSIELEQSWKLVKNAATGGDKKKANPFKQANVGVESYPLELVAEVLTPHYHDIFKKWL